MLSNGGSAPFGLAQDPFWGDAVSLFAFNRGLAENQYRPELFTGTPGNLLAGRNVTAIALQVPGITFGDIDVAAWAQISLHGHAARRKVSRAAHPLLRSFSLPPFGRRERGAQRPVRRPTTSPGTATSCGGPPCMWHN